MRVAITRSGAWLASPAGSPANTITLSNYLENGTGTIAIAVPRDACGVTQTMTVSLRATASNGRAMSPEHRVDDLHDHRRRHVRPVRRRP